MSNWYSCGFIFEGNVPENFSLPVALAGDVRIERLPEWVKADEATSLESWSTRERIKDAVAGFVCEFEASALGAGAQQAAEKIFLAGIALWLAQPTGWSPAHVTHFGDKGRSDSVRQTGQFNVLRVSPDHVYDVPTMEALTLASRLHAAILSLRRDGAIWSALRQLAIAIPENLWEPRYVMVWVALEALFGPNDGREITYRMSQRIGLFLGRDREEQRSLFREARAGYGVRSKVVHGRRLAGLTPEQSVEQMVKAENLIRRALVVLLENPRMAEVFDGKDRETYLDELAFK